MAKASKIPGTAFGNTMLLFVLGFFLTSVGYDLLSFQEGGFEACKAYYFFKAVKPPTFLKVINLTLFVGGAFTHLRNFVDAPKKRKTVEGVGVGNWIVSLCILYLLVAFLLNVALSMISIVPKEKLLGSLFENPDAKWTENQFSTFQSELFLAHMISVVLLLVLFFCQNTSYHTQFERKEKEN